MPERTRRESAWRRAGLAVLVVVAFSWLPLGARDAGGVSAVLAALGPSTPADGPAPTADVAARPLAHVRAPSTVRGRLLLAPVTAVLVAAVLLVVVARTDDATRPRRLVAGPARSRAPPVVV